MQRLEMRHVLGESELDDYEAERRQQLEDAVPWVNFLLVIRERAAGEWADRAACSGHTALMFPERGTSTDPATGFCAACPVADNCRQWSDAYGVTLHGIAAGESARGRRQRRARVADAAPDGVEAA